MSGAVSVPGYPTSNLVPGVYFAVDNSQANTASVKRRVLIVAQMLAGVAVPNVATISGGVSDAIGKYGLGSQAAIMVAAYRAIDSVGELWVLPLADDPAAHKAAGSFAFTGPASGAGVLSLYVGDVLVPVSVNAGDTATAIAANAATAIGASTGLGAGIGVTAAASAGTLTLTARNGGLAGNDVALGLNVLGTAGGQVTPAGVGVTVTQPTGGLQNPTALATELAALGTRAYDLFIHPYNDEASLTAWETFNAGRWQPIGQLFGHAVTAFRGTYGQATALGLTQNDPHQTIMAISDSPSAPMIWAAQVGAQVEISLRQNPALPVTGVALTVMPPSDAGRFGFAQRDSLLGDGISTFLVSDSGTVTIERLVTTYQTSPAGVPDNSYLDIETLMTLMICIQDMNIFLASTFGGCILVADGSKIPAGIKATTAQLIGLACVSRYRTQAANLWVQNPDQFAAQLVATNAGNGLVTLLLPFQLANQLWAIAGNVQFTKP